MLTTPSFLVPAGALVASALLVAAPGAYGAYGAQNTWGGQNVSTSDQARAAAHLDGMPSTDELLQTTNLAARFWRFATTRDPSAGHPQYTFGGDGNTPSSPRAEVGTYTVFEPTEWTSGFFSAGLWSVYDRLQQCAETNRNASGQPSLETWQKQANNWTQTLAPNVHNNVHDLGFLAIPFELQDNLTHTSQWNDTIGKMATLLGSRFVPAAGVFRTWDNAGSHPDSVLVVIDSSMNVPLLIKGAQSYTFNQTLNQIAQSHANKLIQNHVRPDGSTFHVCDYSGTTGELYHCGTAQGLADNSTWARGQAWAIHGFSQMYQLTHNETYLDTARRVADYWIHYLPPDGLPYWDFDAPPHPDTTPRDVSAAMAAASGLATLGTINGATNYTSAAVQLLNATYHLALAQPITFADSTTRASGANVTIGSLGNATGTTGFEAALMHATVNNRQNNYDTGLIYADMYYVEAGNKLLQQGVWPCSAAAAAAQGQNASSSAGQQQGSNSGDHKSAASRDVGLLRASSWAKTGWMTVLCSVVVATLL